MWQVKFHLRGLEKKGAEELRRRSSRRHGRSRSLKSTVRALKAGLAKGSVVLWATVAVVGLYAVQQSSKANLTVTGPNHTPFGLQWQVQGKIPNRRIRQITLEVNGSTQSVPVTDGKVLAAVVLVPGRNSVKLTGRGFVSAASTVIVPSDQTLMGCDCGHLGGGIAGIIGNLLLENCQDNERQLKAGTTKWCSPQSSGPAAWPVKGP